MTSNKAEVMGVVENEAACEDFHDLLDRQIIEYRKELGFHRLDMSINEGRVVSWKEAEQKMLSRHQKQAAA